MIRPWTCAGRAVGRYRVSAKPAQPCAKHSLPSRARAPCIMGSKMLRFGCASVELLLWVSQPVQASRCQAVGFALPGFRRSFNARLIWSVSSAKCRVLRFYKGGFRCVVRGTAPASFRGRRWPTAVALPQTSARCACTAAMTTQGEWAPIGGSRTLKGGVCIHISTVVEI